MFCAFVSYCHLHSWYIFSVYVIWEVFYFILNTTGLKALFDPSRLYNYANYVIREVRLQLCQFVYSFFFFCYIKIHAVKFVLWKYLEFCVQLLVSLQARQLQSSSIIEPPFSKPVKIQKSNIKSCHFVENIQRKIWNRYLFLVNFIIFTNKTQAL